MWGVNLSSVLPNSGTAARHCNSPDGYCCSGMNELAYFCRKLARTACTKDEGPSEAAQRYHVPGGSGSTCRANSCILSSSRKFRVFCLGQAGVLGEPSLRPPFPWFGDLKPLDLRLWATPGLLFW